MSEDDSSSPQEHQERRRGWLERISTMLSGEPSTREDLVELLRDAQADGLIAADTLRMMEGAIAVSDLTVGDVMIPRAQMVALPAEAALLDLMKRVVESGHSRFPVHAMAFHPVLPLLAVGTGRYDGGYFFEGELLLVHLETDETRTLIEHEVGRQVLVGEADLPGDVQEGCWQGLTILDHVDAAGLLHHEQPAAPVPGMRHQQGLRKSACDKREGIGGRVGRECGQVAGWRRERGFRRRSRRQVGRGRIRRWNGGWCWLGGWRLRRRGSGRQGSGGRQNRRRSRGSAAGRQHSAQ